MSDRWLEEAEETFENAHVKPLRNVVALCESPIEKGLLYGFANGIGLRAVNEWPGRICRLPGSGDEDLITEIMLDEQIWIGLGEIRRLILAPQVAIATPGGATYRLDFVLHYQVMDLRRKLVGEVFIDVECDGHDYHERTRHQAERDKRRDREVQQAGYSIARFTGAEIARNAIGVAFDAWDMARRLHGNGRRK